MRRQVRTPGAQHPWRLSLVLSPSFALLGMDRRNSAREYGGGMWGVGVGVAIQRELGPIALRLEVMSRAGAGRIRSYQATAGGNYGGISDRTGAIWAGEVRQQVLIRPHPFYAGPMIAAGVLRLDGRTHREPGETLHVPKLATFVAGGGVIGWELGANGQISLGMSALVGAWDELGHAFVQLGLMEGVVVWD